MRTRVSRDRVILGATFGCLLTWSVAQAAEPAPPPAQSSYDKGEAATLSALQLLSSGNGELDSGRPDSAIEFFNQVIAMEVPNGVAAAACLARGNAYRTKGDLERAMKDYEQALRLNPKNPLGYMYRGLMLVTSGDHEGAIFDLSEAVRLDPKMYRAFYNRAGEYAVTGDWVAARRDIDRALALSPRYPMAIARRGAINAHEKKLKQARADYEKATKLDPSLWLAQAGLAQLDLAEGKYAAALDVLEDCLRSGAPHPAGWLNSMAWIRATCPEASVRDGQKAIQEARRACELSGWRIGGEVETLAAADAEAGDFKNAIAFQWFALGLASDDKARAEAGQRLGLYQSHHPYREINRPYLP